MKIIALDDEYLGLEGVVSAIKAVVANANLREFRDAEEALKSAKKNVPDVAFLDIELRTENGLDVAHKLKELNPKINIIFVTGYSKFMKDAFDMYASGYVLKPVTEENIKSAMENLRFPVLEAKRISIHSFGVFDILGDGVPLKFTYSKSKELLALLVDSKGITVPMGMVEELLWENDDDGHDHRAYIRNLVADIRREFRKYDAEDAIIRSHNNISLDISKVSCDYFDFLEGKADAVEKFKGEYMSQYTWAEKTRENLQKM